MLSMRSILDIVYIETGREKQYYKPNVLYMKEIWCLSILTDALTKTSFCVQVKEMAHSEAPLIITVQLQYSQAHGWNCRPLTGVELLLTHSESFLISEWIDSSAEHFLKYALSIMLLNILMMSVSLFGHRFTYYVHKIYEGVMLSTSQYVFDKWH